MQKIPILKAELAIVETGGEYLAAQLSSEKFAIHAKNNGTIVDVEKDSHIIIQYDDDEKEIFDISPRVSATKRNSIIHISLESCKKGDKVEKGELIAWSKMLDGDSLVQGINNTMAILNYDGASFEDGYVISEKNANKFQTEVVTKINLIVPPNTNVLYFNTNIGEITDRGTLLLEFEYKQNITDYIEAFDLLDNNFKDDLEKLMKKTTDSLKTYSIGGELINIKIRINNLKDTDPLIVQKWTELTNQMKKKITLMKKIGKNEKFLDNYDTSVLRTSGHKFKGNEFEGVLIEFYIKKVKSLEIGDKFANRYGAKGVITKIIPDNEHPKGEFSGEIDVFLSPCGVLGRKNAAIIREMYIGKIIFHLKEKIANMLSGGKKIDDVVKIIYDIYSLLDPTKGKKMLVSIKNKFAEYENNKEELTKKLINKEIKFNYMISPFNIPEFKNIKDAAELLQIPLDEKVYIPKYKMWRKRAVPVGIQYMSAMEQLSSDYESTRSTGGYVSATGQPTKGKSRHGGQSIGNLDIYGLLSYNANTVLKELMVVRSDNMKAKRQVVDQIIKTGSASMPTEMDVGQTSKLLNIIMLGMGLKIN